MKNLIILFFVCFSLNSCAMGGKSATFRERKDQDKLWRPCQDFETQKPIGKLCNRVCIKRRKTISKNKTSTCKVWKTNIKDFSKKDDFMFFRNNSMIMMDEDTIL